MNTFIGIIIPFLGTTLGASLVLFMSKNLDKKIEKFLLGFASGVMISASVFSLIIPSLDMAKEQGVISFLPASIGFILGMLFLLLLDVLVPHINITSKNGKFSKTTMLILAVTIHNIPEGMAVGIVFAGMLAQNVGITLASSLALSIGIAIQNFPEGAIVSMPLRNEGMSKKKSFLYGILSGIVEPVFAILTVLLVNFVTPFMPYFLSFASGAMIYVVINELIPQTQYGKNSYIGTIGVTVGFVLMMILDVALG